MVKTRHQRKKILALRAISIPQPRDAKLMNVNLLAFNYCAFIVDTFVTLLLY
jgi:hypothetical protein